MGDKGFFIQPTVFSDVKDDMKIAKEKIFGPVMQCLKFTDIDDAIERANDTPYGLAAGVCSRDIGKAMGVAKRLKAGSIWINTWNQFDDAIQGFVRPPSRQLWGAKAAAQRPTSDGVCLHRLRSLEVAQDLFFFCRARPLLQKKRAI